MDRKEALTLLRSGCEGVNEWNNCRKRHSSLIAGIPILDKADLHEVDLRRANLRGVSLRMADLRRANLRAANLRGARLDCANLRKADLHLADLSRACLRKATLEGARLSSVRTAKTDFSGSHVGWCVFADVDLSMARGLETVHHEGPSTFGIDTLYRSGGTIPETFLRGCGVPEELITFARKLIGGPSAIQFCSCFISYSTKDEGFCKRLHSRLRDEKLRVWFAPEDLKSGRKLRDQIDAAIRVYDKLLLVLSPHSMNSEWVKTEIYHARQKELREKRTVLFPIRLCDFDAIRQWQCFDADTGKDLAREIREFYIPGDFVNWRDHDCFEEAFAKLMRDLRASAKSTAV